MVGRGRAKDGQQAEGSIHGGFLPFLAPGPSPFMPRSCVWRCPAVVPEDCLWAMSYAGALHVHDSPTPPLQVEAAVAHSQAAGWGEAWSLQGVPIEARRWTRVSRLRRRYAGALIAVPAGWPVVYHQLAGLDIFATEDVGRHRVLWIHEPFDRWQSSLGWAARYADAFIFDREAWHREAVAEVSWIPARRRATIDSNTLLESPSNEKADRMFSQLLQVRIARQIRPRRGFFLPFAFYRHQLKWVE